jgi:hypothetical protein
MREWIDYVLMLLTVVSVSWFIGQFAYWFIYERKGRDNE